MLQKRKPKYRSLRTRHISLALLLGFIMIAGASIGYRTTLIDSQKADELLHQITHQSEHLEHIEELIHASYRSMDLFLLEPLQTEHRQAVTKYIDQGIASINEMRPVDGTGLDDLDEPLARLERQIKQFGIEAEQLFEIRIDPLRQYPTMGIISRTLMPIRNNIVFVLSEAISEAKPVITEPADEKPGITKSADEKPVITESAYDIYTDFVELRHYFDRMSLVFRLFMVNRNGGFNSESITQQATIIEEIYAQILVRLTHLKEHDQSGMIGFDGSTAIEVLEATLPVWLENYRSIKKINDSGDWRLDTLIMQKKILPLTDEITRTIKTIGKAIKLENSQIAQSYNQIRETQTLLLAALIVIIVIYIITMLLSLEKMVFRPIAAVARALKAEAFGEKQELLLHTRTRETQDLIDAFYEMNLQVRNRQMALEYQALHDALTGLPNRTLIQERMDYQLMAAKREEQPMALFILDLNRFKEVNDTLGHHIGDQLLIDVGQRFKRCMREVDTIARLGGDEFAILLPNTARKQSQTVAEKLIETIKEPFTIEENQLYIGVSIGIACYPMDGEDHNTLMQHADVAMYNAKLNHLGYAHYNVAEDDHSVGRLSLIQDLRHAIRHNELELYFQPKVDIYENIPVGAEALLRWKHPELGFIAPDQLVDIAEGVGLIDELTSWVMNRAIAQCAIYHKEGLQLGISINLSVKNLLNDQLSSEIRELLERHQIDSRFVTFEITESSMMDNPENSIKVLNELSEIGVGISVDDFGTGFSSLAYLKQLPVSELKIDKSFVMEMAQNDSDAVIVHSTIELGHNLGLYVVAEGVENQQTCDIIKHYGCDMVQGYFISRPLPANEFMAWLRTHTDRSPSGS